VFFSGLFGGFSLIRRSLWYVASQLLLQKRTDLYFLCFSSRDSSYFGIHYSLESAASSESPRRMSQHFTCTVVTSLLNIDDFEPANRDPFT